MFEDFSRLSPHFAESGLRPLEVNLLGKTVWDKTGVRLLHPHPLSGTLAACPDVKALSFQVSALGLARGRSLFCERNPIILCLSRF